MLILPDRVKPLGRRRMRLTAYLQNRRHSLVAFALDRRSLHIVLANTNLGSNTMFRAAGPQGSRQ